MACMVLQSYVVTKSLTAHEKNQLPGLPQAQTSARAPPAQTFSTHWLCSVASPALRSYAIPRLDKAKIWLVVSSLELPVSRKNAKTSRITV